MNVILKKVGRKSTSILRSSGDDVDEKMYFLYFSHFYSSKKIGKSSMFVSLLWKWIQFFFRMGRLGLYTLWIHLTNENSLLHFLQRNNIPPKIAPKSMSNVRSVKIQMKHHFIENRWKVNIEVAFKLGRYVFKSHVFWSR